MNNNHYQLFENSPVAAPPFCPKNAAGFTLAEILIAIALIVGNR